MYHATHARPLDPMLVGCQQTTVLTRAASSLSLHPRKAPDSEGSCQRLPDTVRTLLLTKSNNPDLANPSAVPIPSEDRPVHLLIAHWLMIAMTSQDR